MAYGIYEGEVTFMNNSKGFGFIFADEGQGLKGKERKHFVHESWTQGMDGFRILAPGDKVEFNSFPPMQAGKDNEAHNVRVVDSKKGVLYREQAELIPAGTVKISFEGGGILMVNDQAMLAQVQADGIRVFEAAGKIDKFDVVLPLATDEVIWLMLEWAKTKRNLKTEYKGVLPGFRIMRVEKTGHVTVMNVGFRHQKDSGRIWIVIERRFDYTFDLDPAAEKSVIEQAKGAGSDGEDNEGFAKVLVEYVLPLFNTGGEKETAAQ